MKSYKKICLIILLIIFISGPIISYPKKVKAFSPGVVAINVGKWIWEKVGDALNFAALNTVYKLTDYTAEYIAQQAAFGVLNKLLEGETGEKPLFETKTAAELFKDVANSAAGDFIGDLSSSAGFEKFDLCAPSLDVQLSVTMSLLDVEKPPPPKCDFNKVVQNWRQFGETLKDAKLANILQVNFVKKKLDVSAYDTIDEQSTAYNEYFDNLFSMGTNELGLFLSIKEKQEEAEAKALAANKAEFAKCQGFRDKKTAITQKKQTGCEQLSDILLSSKTITDEQAMKKTDFQSLTWKGVPLALSNAIANASMSFIMTISGQLAKFYIEKGLLGMHQYEDDDAFDDLVQRLRGGFDFSRPPRGYDVSREMNVPSFQELPEYSLLTNYVVCPGEDDMRRADHCVIDNEFLSLITKRQTIRELIDEGSLNSNMAFIGPGNPSHQSHNCYKNGLCYKNLVKLRKAGVLPVGWELAALRSSDNNPVILSEVIDCFEDAADNNPNYNCKFGLEGSHNPYYHLVDEDWVLKEPKASCPHLVYSNELQSSISSRRVQYCADFKTCLEEDDQGNCKTDYGYCTRSENLWRFDGETCSSLYGGCLTFDNVIYGKESYIQDTLEYCTSNNAGCLRYSQEKNTENDWVLTNVSSDSNDLFLNGNTNTCPDDYVGCSEYIVMTPAIGSSSGPNLIPNSEFELGILDNDYLFLDGWETVGLNGGIRVGTTAISTDIPLLSNTIYSLSVSAAQTGGSSEAIINIKTCSGNNNCNNNNGAAGEEGVGNCLIGQGLSNNIDLRFIPSGTSMERDVCVFKTNDYVNSGEIYISANSGTLDFDDIQLKIISSEEEIALDYSSYGVGGKINLNGDRVMCEEVDVGCQGYTSANDGYVVPAIITQNDLCPDVCVNYDSFAQMPSIFDESENNYEVEYYNFIPETGSSCPVQYVGCEKFTNLGSQEEGGESIEYYSFLRQCVSENNVDAKEYYTWESSDVSGYQIQIWTALKSNLDNAPCTNISAGGDTCQDTDNNIAICGSETGDPYDDPEYNPNCLEFFDTDGGATYWRLQDRLIFARNDCYDYRRDSSGQLYKAITSLSTSCPAQYNNCKAYKGNFANNLRRVFRDDFEDGTYGSWSSSNGSLDISNESLSNNGQSLKLSTNATFIRSITDTLQINKNFELSWWMKNIGIIDNIKFTLIDNAGEELINLGELPADSNQDIAISNWQDYKLSFTNDDFNEIDYSSLEDNVSLKLVVNGTDYIYLDNLELKETIGNVSIIKNSWQTDILCDLPYTGYHLGCKLYTDTNGNSYNVKSFNQLCQEETIGCTGVINTHNSDSPFEEIYHLSDASEITVLEDNVEYLVPDISKYCPGEYKGCSILGLPKVSSDGTINAYDTVLRVNDPDKYDTNLCVEEGLYCSTFINSQGQSFYFKYPGERLCQYKNDVVSGDALISGWFKTDTLNTDNPVECDTNDYEVENWVNICPENQNLCTDFRDPNHISDCNPNETDPNNSQYCDINEEGDFQSYYYFDNDDIDKTSCAGTVDQNSGCMLFYNSNNWNSSHSEVLSLYDSEQTYSANMSIGSPVSPVTCDQNDSDCNLDSNELIKVEKDRKCSEWLACKSVTQVTDNNGQIKNICDSIGICSKYNYEASDTFRSCAQWGQHTNLDDDIIDNIHPLTTENYQDRTSGVSNYLDWSDEEYLGYSIPNILPVESMVSYNFDSGSRLVVNTGIHSACEDNSDGTKNDGDDCSITKDTYTFSGECAEERCWVNPKIGENSNIYFGLSTRGYGIEEAPFPDTVIDSTNQVNPNYQQAEICNSIKDSGCETIYQKVSYGLNYFKYIKIGEESPPAACTDGHPEMLGASCTPGSAGDETCKAGSSGTVSFGSCSAKTKVETYYNWPGICIEYDESPEGSNIIVDIDTAGDLDRVPNLCSQWYPVESISGTDSLYDNYNEAGFYNPTGQDLYFCSAVGPFYLQENRLYCVNSDINDDNCNVVAYVPMDSKININAMEGDNLLSTGSWVNADDLGSSGLAFGTIGDDNTSIITSLAGVKATKTVFSGVVNTKDSVIALFDARTSSAGEIKFYYFDEDVNTNSTSSAGDKILVPGYSTDTHSWCHYCGEGSDGPSHNNGMTDNAFTGGRSSNSGWAEGRCPNNTHAVYFTCAEKSGVCDWQTPERSYVYCNPGNDNYYVYTEGAAISEPGIDIQICGGSTGFGSDCFLWNGPGSHEYCTTTGSGVPTGDYLNFCNNMNSFVPGTTYSSSYGTVHDCTEEGSMAPVWTSFTEDQLNSLQVCLFGTDTNNDGNCNAGCPPTMEVTPGGEDDAGDYGLNNPGIECQGLNCYQQCDIISKLDFDGGTHSANNTTKVRTDIWWRGINNPTNFHIGSWTAFYYNNSSYSESTDINFSKVGGIDIDTSNYGGTFWMTGLPIITQVPLNTEYFSNLYSAPIFFGQTLSLAEANLQYLFRRVHNLTRSGNTYIDSSTDEIGAGLDSLNNYAGTRYTPYIYKVDCSQNNLCSANEQGVTVEYDNIGNAAVKFYYYAYPDSMPIKKVSIDWDDGGSFIGTSGKYKNKLPRCNPDWVMPHSSCPDNDENYSCDNPQDLGVAMQGFGGTADACSEGYKVFQYNYIYKDNHKCDGTGGKPDIASTSCYKPSIQITDWWDYSTTISYDDWITVD